MGFCALAVGLGGADAATAAGVDALVGSAPGRPVCFAIGAATANGFLGASSSKLTSPSVASSSESRSSGSAPSNSESIPRDASLGCGYCAWCGWYAMAGDCAGSDIGDMAAMLPGVTATAFCC